MATLNKILDDGGKTKCYEVRYDSFNAATGKRSQHRKRFKRRTDAVAFMSETVDAVNKGTYTQPTRKLLIEWLDEWLAKKIVEADLEQKTIESYEWSISKVKQHLGGYTLQSLEPSVLEYFLYVTLRQPKVDGMVRKKTWELLGSTRTRLIKMGDRGVLVREAKELLAEEGYFEGTIDRDFDEELFKAVCAYQSDHHPPALANKSLRHVYTVLSAALTDARRKKLIGANPMDDVDIPKLKPKVRNIPDLKGALHILETLSNEEVYIPVLIAMMAGLRRSEVLGLTWSDVDLQKETLRVRTVIVSTAKKGNIAKAPKTDSSLRTVVLPNSVAAELKIWKKKQAERRLLLGTEYVTSDAVCTWKNGKPFAPDGVSDAFERALRRHMLPPLTFHGLRHTHASMLHELGMSPKLISERLGHKTVGVTLEVYTHLVDDADRQAAQKLDTVRSGKTEQDPGEPKRDVANMWQNGI